jgi:hypothetical protein
VRDYDDQLAQSRTAMPELAADIDAMSRQFHGNLDVVCLATLNQANMRLVAISSG